MNTIELMKKRLAELASEKAEIKARTAELREKREVASASASKANAEALALTEKILAIERPRMIEINEEMSRLALALGGKRMGG